MNFATITAVLLSLVGVAAAADDNGYTTDFVPIVSPAKGDVVPPGSTWDMKWSKGADGVETMNLILYSGNGSQAPAASELDEVQVIIRKSPCGASPCSAKGIISPAPMC